MALRLGSSGTAGTGVASRIGKVGPVRVTLEDRNGKLPAGARDRAERIAEQMIALYGDPIGSDGPLVIPLRYFDTEEAYVDYAMRDSWVEPSWHGFYSPQRDEIVVSNRGAYFEILIHEINHFIVRRIFPEAPRWLDEGLSEYFEHASFRGEELMIESGSYNKRLGDWWRGGQEPGLRELLGMNASTWGDHDREKGLLVRALSWSVIDFMMSSAEGVRTLREFIARLRDGRGLYSFEALERTYRGGARAFEEGWLERIKAHVE